MRGFPYLMDLFQTIAHLPKWGYSLSGRSDKCSLYSKRHIVIITGAGEESNNSQCGQARQSRENLRMSRTSLEHRKAREKPKGFQKEKEKTRKRKQKD